MKRLLLALSLLLVSLPALAASPVWTDTYDTALTPEANGYTRLLYGSPAITVVSNGSPGGRHVAIDATNGDAYFLTSTVPTLEAFLGATLEWKVGVVGPGEAGMQLTFLDHATLVDVFADSVTLNACSDVGGGYVSQNVPTASNAAATTTFRLTFDMDSQIRLYRNGVLTVGPLTAPQCLKDSQSILWWGESGATATFTSVSYYLGGPVAP